jgi:hypothetical protein
MGNVHCFARSAPVMRVSGVGSGVLPPQRDEMMASVRRSVSDGARTGKHVFPGAFFGTLRVARGVADRLGEAYT